MNPTISSTHVTPRIRIRNPLVITSPVPIPSNDGIDHINTHISSTTELGKQLSHYNRSRFVHPIFGVFYSMEGFLHYIRSGDNDNKFRTMSANLTRVRMKEKLKIPGFEILEIKNLRKIIFNAMFYKIHQNKELKKAFIASTLPFDHYYTSDGKGNIITATRPNNSDRLVEDITRLRSMFIDHRSIEEIDYEPLLAMFAEATEKRKHFIKSE